MRTDNSFISPSTLTRQRRSGKMTDLGSYDAIIVGGGIGGCAAAAKLGRQGLRVALLESSGVLGWEIVRARQLHVHWPSLFEHTSEAAKLHERIAARHGHMADGMLDPVATAVAVDEWIVAAGVDLLLHTWPAELIIDASKRVTGMTAACKSGYASVQTRCVIDATWEAKLAKSVFGSQPAISPPSPSYTMLWSETEVTRPTSCQLELSGGLTCRIAVSPTYWPKEAHVIVSFASGQTIAADCEDRMTRCLFGLTEKLRGAVPELTDGLVSYVSDRSWQSPSFTIQSGAALADSFRPAGMMLTALNADGSGNFIPIHAAALTDSKKADGFILAGPWLNRYPIDTAAQHATSQLIMLGEAAAETAGSQAYNPTGRHDDHVHQS